MQRADQQRPPLDAVLKRGLERQRDPGGKDCPDDATLAAYCERSLPPSESARWEGNFTNCARCLGILAAIARAQTAARVTLPRTRWRRWQPYAALAAGVAGISIALNLMLTGRHQRVPAAFSVRNETAASAPFAKQAPAGIGSTGPQIALNEPAPQAIPGTSAPSQQQAAIAALKLIHPMAGGAGFFSQPERAARATSPAAENGKELARRAALGTETAAQAPPFPPAPPQLAMKERGLAPFGASNASVPALASEAATAESGAPIAGMTTASRAAAMAVISTPDGDERWRVGAGGMIQHWGTDGEWYRQTSGVGTDLTAGAAPSAEVCWVVGTHGIVLRTTDGGEHWHRMSSPTAANLVAVSAADALSAAISTAGGRVFATTDGARTWKRP